MGRLADFFRLAWGFLYWNARKSVFRFRRPENRTHGKCPCQHPSDSGRAFETACAAVAGWNDPTRFRRLCPLLQKNAAGQWRCSVNSADVRPFWGRVVAFYGISFSAAYLLLALIAFLGLRSIGYEVGYRTVAWPPAWVHLKEARVRFFLSKYQSATAAGDMQTALLSLSTAYALDPRQYAVGRQLAQSWQVGQPGLSDQIYQRLLDDHPSEAESTAQAWLRALLARGNFTQIEKLSASRIAAAPDTAAPWLGAFLFANQRTRDAAARRALSETSSLPDFARALLRLYNALESVQSPAEAQALLNAAAANARDSATFFHTCRQLLARGFAQDALRWMNAREDLLSPRDRLPVRLDAFAELGWEAVRHSDIETLLLPPPSASIVELLSAHLIRHPDRAILRNLIARLNASPLAATPENYAAQLALFCAAGACGDKEAIDWAGARIRDMVGGNFRGLEAMGAVLLDSTRSRHLENYLPVLQPLPLETVYALFDHYAPPKP